MSAGTVTVGVAFNNSGTVDIKTGTLDLGDGGTDTGVFDVEAPDALRFTGGTHDLEAGTTFEAQVRRTLPAAR